MKGSKNLINLGRSGIYRIKHKNNDFPLYGLDLVLGKFGSGKTLTVVDRVYDILDCYPDCRLISNVQFLKLDKKDYYYTEDEISFMNTLLKVLSTTPEKGCLIVIDEVKLFLAETLRDEKSRLCNAFLTILGQVRKLHCYFFITSQLYNKVPKVLRDFIVQNGDIVICKKLFPGFTYYMYYDMSSIEEDSKIRLKGRFRSFNYLIHSPELYTAYDTKRVVSSVKGLLDDKKE